MEFAQNETQHTLKSAKAWVTRSFEADLSSRIRIGNDDKTFSTTTSWLRGAKGSTPLREDRQSGHGNPEEQ